MSKPRGQDLEEFSQTHIWDIVTVDPPPQRINVREEFVAFLRARGFPQIICEEYTEHNLTLLLTRIVERCEEWDALGVPRPLSIINQGGSMITWAHPNFERASGFARPEEGFMRIWNRIRNCYSRDFLLPCASYLYCIGCNRIYITDGAGDGGVDIIGTGSNNTLRGLLFLIQSKSAAGTVSKEALFADFAKYLILPRHSRWKDYLTATGLRAVVDGLCTVFVFASNGEFSSAVRQTGRELPVILRSGRQIANCLAQRCALHSWESAWEVCGELRRDLSKNLANCFSLYCGSTG